MGTIKHRGIIIFSVIMVLLLVMSGCTVSFSGFSTTSGHSDYKDFNSTISPDGHYNVSGAEITSIDTKWVSGSVKFEIAETDMIDFTETAAAGLDDNTALQYGVINGTLYIQFCKPNYVGFIPEKHLTVTIPRTLAEGLETFRNDCSSADYTMYEITANSFSFDSSSGSLNAKNMNVISAVLDASSGDLSYDGSYNTIRASASSGSISITSMGEPESTDIDASSGDITLFGSMGDLHANTSSGTISGDVSASRIYTDTSSGDVTLSANTNSLSSSASSGYITYDLAVCPNDIDISTSSGNVELTLPENSEFEVEYDTSSGNFQCELPTVQNGGNYTCGSGSASFRVDTTSGDLAIRKS